MAEYKEIFDYLYKKTNSNEVSFCIMLVIDNTRNAYLHESANKGHIDIINIINDLNKNYNTGLYYKIENEQSIAPKRYLIYGDSIKSEIYKIDILDDNHIAKYLNFSHSGIDLNIKNCVAHYYIFNENFITEMFPADMKNKYEHDIFDKCKKYNETFKKIFNTDKNIIVQIKCNQITNREFVEKLERKDFTDFFNAKDDIVNIYQNMCLIDIPNYIDKLKDQSELEIYFNDYFDLLFILAVLNEETIQLNQKQYDEYEKIMNMSEKILFNYYMGKNMQKKKNQKKVRFLLY